MIYKGNNKFGFSLTELLIVLVVVVVLFAAMAPIMTKKRISTGDWRRESVWHYAPGDDQLSAYFDVNASDFSPVDMTNSSFIEQVQQNSSYLDQVRKRAQTGDAPAISFLLHGITDKNNKPITVLDRYINLEAYGEGAPHNVRHMKSLPIRGAKIVELVQSKSQRDKVAQHAIQFRYGNGDGVNAGTFYVDNKGTFALGAGYTLRNSHYSSAGDFVRPIIFNGRTNDNGVATGLDTATEVSKPGSTIMGLNALQNVNIAENVTVVGDYALSVSDIDCSRSSACRTEGVDLIPKNVSIAKEKSLSTKIISIGYNSGKISSLHPLSESKQTTLHNINALFLGSNVGSINTKADSDYADPKAIRYNNVAIGFNSLNHPKFTGTDNVVIGSNVGTKLGNANRNVLINTDFKDNSPKYEDTFNGNNNTIIGSNVGSVPNNLSNFTAIGYNACTNFRGYPNNPPVTCIGYNTVAPQLTNTKPSDSFVFLGGKAPNEFGSHSVLEVYDVDGTYTPADGGENITNSSVVLNSNLIVRGDLYVGARNKSSSTNKNVIHYMRPVAINSASDAPSGHKYYSINYLNYVQLYDNYYHTLGNDSNEDAGILLRYTNDEDPLSGSFDNDYNHINHSWYDSNSNCTNNICWETYFMKKGALFPALDFSDIRLKENLTLNNSGLDEILKIQPYTFAFRFDSKQAPQVGVVAQDLQKVFPNSVTKGKDGFLRIRWNEMFFAMINAIKELGAKVEKIASDILHMENDVKLLDKKNKDIKKRTAELNARAARLERK